MKTKDIELRVTKSRKRIKNIGCKTTLVKFAVASVGWGVMISLYSVFNDLNDQDAYIREQEMEYIQKGYIDPYEGLENVMDDLSFKRMLAHNDEPELGPLTPEDQAIYDAFMAV